MTFLPARLLSLLVLASALSPATAPQAAAAPEIEQRLIPPDRPWRLPKRELKPQYITIHSTANEGRGANAIAHAKLLARPEGFTSSSKLSRTGYRSWHFTVDDTRIVQHLPTNEQGDHADFTGPGNQISIGIEICVNRDGNLENAIERTVDLTAHLMKTHSLDIDHVVPHHYWAQPPHGHHKACPAIFMDGQKPGAKWQAFKARISERLKQLP